MNPPPDPSGPGPFGRRARRTPPATPQRLSELQGQARRRAVVRTAATVLGTWVLLGVTYFALPGAGYSGWREAGRLGLSMAMVGAVFVSQTRSVGRSAMPELRAIQAIGVVIPLFLLTFSMIYLSLSNGSAGAFTERLDHASALYFTITVFATVGFGDITALSHSARMIVSVQMLLDLVILGTVVRVILGAARSAFTRHEESDEPTAR